MPYVITELGTVLCATSNGNLTHSPDFNDTSVVQYSYKNGSLSFDTFIEANCYTVHQILEVLPKCHRKCNIIVNGHYLNALVDGHVSKSSSPSEDGGNFFIISNEEFDILKKVTGRDYFSKTENRKVSKGEVYITDKFLIKWPSITCELSSFLKTCNDHNNTISFLYDEWKIEILKPYRPLIYFAAFGSESIFSCLNLSCQSLYKFGDYDGEICVITDKSYHELQEILSTIHSDKLHVLRISADDVLDYTHARFKITELPGIEQFSPILYMDTDILCNAPVSSILADLINIQGVACATELAFDINDEFYGRGLFFGDQSVAVPDNMGISSGFFGAANINQIRELCRFILHSSYALAAANNNRHHFTYMDQPCFNYVVRKLGYFDFRLTDYIVSLVGNLTGPHDHIQKHGFIHFCGGVGNSWPKLSAMKVYFEHLSKNEDA